MKLCNLLIGVSLALYVASLSTWVFAQDLHIEEPPSSGVYSSDANIIAQNNCLIEKNNVVLFAASGIITLKPGFFAKSGSAFKAIVGNYGDLTNDSDDDGDELIDWRELVDFGDFSQNRDGDYDGDGVTNYVEYKLNSNPNDVYDKPAPGIHYGYDALGRVMSVIHLLEPSSNNYEIQFSYDSKGNRITRIVHTIQP